MKAKRKRSELTRQDCLDVFERFAKLIRRFGETSDPSVFTGPNSRDLPPMGPGEINVQLLVTGSYGSSDEFFEAVRVLAGHKLPARKRS